MQASHSSNVTENLPTANCRENATRRCGPSSEPRSASLAGEPMVNEPDGTTTISGQASHSLKLSFGLSARSRSGDSGVTWRDGNTPTAGCDGAGGVAGGQAA